MINKKNNPIHDFWFDKDVTEIYIVCSRESSPPSGAYKYSNDYAYSDNFGDKDLLFLLYGLISRNYPNARIFFYYSDDFIEKTRFWQGKNILIVGGPNSRNYVSSFGMYTALSKVIDDNNVGIRIFYPPKQKNKLNAWENTQYTKENICVKCPNYEQSCCRQTLCILKENEVVIKKPDFYEELIIPKTDAINAKISDDRIIREIEDSGKVAISGCLKQDVGFFATFANPYDEEQKNRIIIINGVYTFGGLGVCHVLNGMSNYSKKVYNKLHYIMQRYQSKDFMACFTIPISEQRDVGKALINDNEVYPLNPMKDINFSNCFISYRRKTSSTVAQYVFEEMSKYSEEGILPFIDRANNRNSFRAGQDYVNAINARLGQVDVVILIIGKECFKYADGENDVDGNFKSEFFSAIEKGKRIIPLEALDADYYEELSSIKEEIIQRFGKDKFKEVLHYNSIKENEIDSLINEIKEILNNYYE